MKVLLVIDGANIAMQTKKLGKKPNYPALMKLVADPKDRRFLWEAVLFSTVPPRNGEGIARFHHAMKEEGMIVIIKQQKERPDGTRKGNVDVMLAIETIKWVESAKPDVVVLASGDGDFVALADYLRFRGIRVEIASLRDSLAAELRVAAHCVIDLAEWLNQCEPWHVGRGDPLGEILA
jgi:uncharacterized LabA/DUF88 family protein